MGNFWDKAQSFLGVGESGSGGSSDAYENFLKYSQNIGGTVNQYMAQVNAEGANPYTAGLTKSFSGLDTAISQASRGSASRLRQLGGQLPGMVRQSALGSTTGAQTAATQAARVAGGGRGGLAFGGGAGAMAARAGQQAGVQQSAAMSQAVLQGQQMSMGAEQAAYGIESQGMQQRLGLAQAISGATAQQAGLEEQRRSRTDQLRQSHIQGLFGLGGSGMYGGLQGDSAMQQRRTGLFSSLFG